MQSGLQLKEISPNADYYENQYGFSAEIKMNARDRMVSAELKSLPKSLNDIQSSLGQFYHILENDYGGKIFLTIPDNLLESFKDLPIPNSNGPWRYITKSNLDMIINDQITKKNHIVPELHKFETGEYQFLTKDNLKLITEQLSNFKINHGASFASEEKINAGMYSEKAEIDKLNNEFVEQYAIMHNDNLIACGMVFVAANKAYISDFVIHRDYRSIDPKLRVGENENHLHGFAQLFCVKIHEHFFKHYENINMISIIAGAHGGQPSGQELNDHIFRTITLEKNPELQKKLGLIIMFRPARHRLLKASNCDLTTQQVNQTENEFKTKALEVYRSSPERKDLAAKLPPPIKTPSITTVSFIGGNTSQKSETEPQPISSVTKKLGST